MTVLPSRSAVSGTWSPDVNEATSVVSRCSSSTSEHSSASVAYENENMVDSVNVHTAATTINDVQSLRASSPPEPVTRRGLLCIPSYYDTLIIIRTQLSLSGPIVLQVFLSQSIFLSQTLCQSRV